FPSTRAAHIRDPGFRSCWCSTTRHEPWQVTGNDAGDAHLGCAPMGVCVQVVNVRLLTNIGRLWTGSEVWSNAAILTHGDQIAWVGPAAELPRSLPGVIDDIVDVDDVQNLNGGLVTPGFIDAHTHPVYAGNRWAEIAMRTSGPSANEISAAGGGVASTGTVTRGTAPWTLCNGGPHRPAAWADSD